LTRVAPWSGQGRTGSRCITPAPSASRKGHLRSAGGPARHRTRTDSAGAPSCGSIRTACRGTPEGSSSSSCRSGGFSSTVAAVLCGAQRRRQHQ
jgi:hypothetical protein